MDENLFLAYLTVNLYQNDPFALPDIEAHLGSDGVAGGVGITFEF
jgi:hypothetical protein